MIGAYQCCITICSLLLRKRSIELSPPISFTTLLHERSIGLLHPVASTFFTPVWLLLISCSLKSAAFLFNPALEFIDANVDGHDAIASQLTP